MKINKKSFITTLLILCLLNNVQCGPVWGSVTYAGCISAYVACVAGTAGLFSIPCYGAYLGCFALGTKEYIDDKSSFADESE